MPGLAAWADAPQQQRYTELTKTYCVKCHNDKAKIGGLSLQSAADYAGTGVDYLAVGALTHSARVLDIGLDI